MYAAHATGVSLVTIGKYVVIKKRSICLVMFWFNWEGKSGTVA
jgi:hypothetical protein